MPAARAVVIDPDPQWQQVMTHELSRSDILVVANSGELRRATELTEAHRADLLVLGLGGEVDPRELYSLLRRVHKQCPNLVTVVVVVDNDRRMIDGALAGGAFWAIDRSLGAHESARVVSNAYRAFHNETSLTRDGARARLTRREVEILTMVAEGRPDLEVAKILWVTDQTIKFHLQNTYKKLHVRNRVEATQWAIAHGLVPPHDNPDDDPGPGVREPRRPINPPQSGGIALDPPETTDELGSDKSMRTQAA